MTDYNYHWSVKKQKKIAEKRICSYIRNIVSRYSPYYRKVFEDLSIDPSEIYSIEDITKIPPISKVEHMNDPEAFILKPYQPDWWECNYKTTPLKWGQNIRYWLRTIGKSYFRNVFGKEPVSEEDQIIISLRKIAESNIVKLKEDLFFDGEVDIEIKVPVDNNDTNVQLIT